jgi:hypothetical protein
VPGFFPAKAEAGMVMVAPSKVVSPVVENQDVSETTLSSPAKTRVRVANSERRKSER